MGKKVIAETVEQGAIKLVNYGMDQMTHLALTQFEGEIKSNVKTELYSKIKK
jgi:hypothetical protein